MRAFPPQRDLLVTALFFLVTADLLVTIAVAGAVDGVPQPQIEAAFYTTGLAFILAVAAFLVPFFTAAWSRVLESEVVEG